MSSILKKKAEEIRDEVRIRRNTAKRVGSLLVDLIDASLQLGENVNTAYSGDKGKANADSIKLLQRSISSVFNVVREDGLHFLDTTGKDIMNYTSLGFDVARVSAHFLSLILSTGVVTADMLSDEVKKMINTLNLGEDSGTAYEGSKGKANADAVKILKASIKAINDSLESVSSIIKVNESGYHFPDSTGKDIMNYTSSGFDVARVSAHFLSLILSAGVVTADMLSDEVKKMINTLNLGEDSGTAYEGSKGKANADAVKILKASIKAINDSLESVSSIIKVNESGYHFPDSTGKDIMNYTSSGFDVARVSAHFLSLILSAGVVTADMLSDEVKKMIVESSGNTDYLSSIILKVVESGYHFPDSSGKDVMNYTEKGFDVAKVSSHFIEVLNRSGISGSLTYEIINDKIYNF